MTINPVLLAWVTLVGLMFGSFVNALVWRLRKHKNFVSERSICVHCKHVLAWYDLVPVFSWLSLRGKCRYCKKKIDDSPIVEVVTAVLFSASYYWWPFDLIDAWDYGLLAFWLVHVVGLMALAVYDLRWMLLPNNLLFPLTGVAVVQRLYEALFIVQASDPIQDMVAGALLGGGLFYILFQVSSGRWIGGGDVKLGFYMGILLGPADVGLAILVGFYAASFLLLPLIVTRRLSRKSKVPFGPFLISGLLVMVLHGGAITNWFRNLYGL